MEDKEVSLHQLNFGHSTDKKTFQAASRKLEKNIYLLSTVIGTASFTYAGGFASNAAPIFSYQNNSAWCSVNSFFDFIWLVISHPTLHFFYAIIFLCFGLLGTSKDYENLNTKNQSLNDQLRNKKDIREQLTSCQEEIAKLNAVLRKKHEELVKTWLKGAFSHLMDDDKAIVKENTHARVSIYYVYNNHFYMLARYSPNAEYDEVHRQKFSMGKGLIHQIYKHLEIHENSLSKYQQASPEQYYKTIETKYGYKQGQLEKFSMKSCRYFGRAIREADMTIGIILFESTNANDLVDDPQIQNIRNYCERNWSHLCQFVRHGIEHDITSKHHDDLRTDQDVLGELSQLSKTSKCEDIESETLEEQ